MRQMRIPAVFMRGGTSKAIVFHQRDLPADRREWDAIFLAAIGSPDANGRQLDGLGGGISSLSKVCVVGPPSRPDADIDYTFAQVSVKDATVDYSGNCGNMSSAMGPFALDEGLIQATGGATSVRIHNTNTNKIIVSRFAVDDGLAAVDGDFALPGVAGHGAPIRLEFLDPGGAGTGKLLPTGNAVDRLDVPGLGIIQVSMVDAANACAFVRAGDLGLTGTEMPGALDADTALLDKLDRIRRTASVAMGIAASFEAAKSRVSSPKIGFVSPPQAAKTLAGEALAPSAMDLTARMISVGQPHRAVPLTAALCIAVAARVAGTLVNQAASGVRPEADIRIAQPSGLTVVAAHVRQENTGWRADHAVVYRTARRLMDGTVYVSAAKVVPGHVRQAAE
ncbi:MAG: PrpF family protein [Alphaproteobacteria bacterium]|nr:PrpF family protein [Alphaproteobacteria bacterium]